MFWDDEWLVKMSSNFTRSFSGYIAGVAGTSCGPAAFKHRGYMLCVNSSLPLQGGMVEEHNIDLPSHVLTLLFPIVAGFWGLSWHTPT